MPGPDMPPRPSGRPAVTALALTAASSPPPPCIECRLASRIHGQALTAASSPPPPPFAFDVTSGLLPGEEFPVMAVLFSRGAPAGWQSGSFDGWAHNVPGTRRSTPARMFSQCPRSCGPHQCRVAGGGAHSAERQPVPVVGWMDSRPAGPAAGRALQKLYTSRRATGRAARPLPRQNFRWRRPADRCPCRRTAAGSLEGSAAPAMALRRILHG